MNLAARRVATLAAGTAIVASGFAATATAAHAAKPGSGATTPKSLELVWVEQDWGNEGLIDYVVPEAERNVVTASCWLDAVPVECQAGYYFSQENKAAKQAEYVIWLGPEVAPGDHTYRVVVKTKSSTYDGSLLFTKHS